MTERERPSDVNVPSSAQRVLQPLQGSVQQTTPPSSSLSQAGAGTTSGTTASGENVLQSSSLGNAAGTNVPDNSAVSLEVYVRCNVFLLVSYFIAGVRRYFFFLVASRCIFLFMFPSGFSGAGLNFRASST